MKYKPSKLKKREINRVQLFFKLRHYQYYRKTKGLPFLTSKLEILSARSQSFREMSRIYICYVKLSCFRALCPALVQKIFQSRISLSNSMLAGRLAILTQCYSTHVYSFKMMSQQSYTSTYVKGRDFASQTLHFQLLLMVDFDFLSIRVYVCKCLLFTFI